MKMIKPVLLFLAIIPVLGACLFHTTRVTGLTELIIQENNELSQENKKEEEMKELKVPVLIYLIPVRYSVE